MARYTGPKTKIARKFGEPIFGTDKYFEKRNFPPGQHGLARKRKKTSEYGVQLKEKQKVKYTYGLLERQFRNTYEKASRMKGQKGENLIILLESRLDKKCTHTEKLDRDTLVGLLKDRFDTLDWDSARDDVMNFIEPSQLGEWDAESFKELTDRLDVLEE